jgi:hypothetical protein
LSAPIPDLARVTIRGWKRVHPMLGGNAERCYQRGDLDVKMARTQRKYEHKATCGTVIQLSATMHKRVMQGPARQLKRTGGKLNCMTFTGKII